MVRATPLPPDERRAAIITATVPLLRQRGREISTREIAEAAGIAEGTIFRVFASKEELIDAVIDDAFDPTASYQALAAIDDTLDLDARIRCAVTILQQRLNRVFGLVHVLGFRPPGGEPRRGGADRSLETSALVAVLAPDASRLKVPTDRAATMLSALVLALSHPIMRGDCGTKPQPEPDEITDIFLHGITRSMEGR